MSYYTMDGYLKLEDLRLAIEAMQPAKGSDYTKALYLKDLVNVNFSDLYETVIVVNSEYCLGSYTGLRLEYR